MPNANYRNRIQSIRVIACGILIAMPSFLHAAQYWYVAPFNNGTTNGLSWDTAWTDLGHAIAAAADDDTLCVMTGRYSVASQIEVAGRTLAIQGGYLGGTPEPGARTNHPNATVFDAGQSGRVLSLSDASDTIWDTLTFENGFTNAHGGGIRIADSTAVFSNCVVRNNQLAGSETQGAGIYNAGGTLTLDHCRLTGNRSTGVGTKYGGAISQTSTGILSMRHSVIDGNFATYHAAGHLWGTVEIFNCLIRNNQAAVNGVLTTRGAVRIINTTIADNSPDGVRRAGGSVVITNSIVWNNQNDIVGSPVTAAYCAIGIGDAEGGPLYRDDPLFVLGYFLEDGSPYLTAGGDTAANLNLETRYAQTNTADSGMAALGYHAPEPFRITVPDLYVDPAGSDANPGDNPALPLQTIGQALELAEPGARIHLAAGHYTTNSGETFPLIMQDGPLQLLGHNASATIIDAGGLATTQRVIDGFNLANGTVLGNLTITGGNLQTAHANGSGIRLQQSAVRFAGCILTGNRIGGGENNGGGMYAYGGTIEMVDCTISDNHRTGNTIYGVGISQRLGTLRMDRCVVNGNTGNHAGGIYMAGADVRIRNSLIVSNTSTYGGIFVQSGALLLENVTLTAHSNRGLRGPATVVNSILWGNGIDVENSVTARYSCIDNGTYTDEGGNLNLDPMFVSAETGNYRLKRDRDPSVTSPCLDAGENQGWMPGARDLDGRPRIMPGHTLPAPVYRVDMGAYEVAPPAGSIMSFR